jgi:predicted RNase H-like nuclease (RuvC/YqgF family)
VREGTLRDAILFSFSANGTHGLRRTAADKRKAVMAMLEDIEWQDWSDREIARQCCVSHPFVSAIRKEMGADKSEKKMNVRGKTTTRIQQPVEKQEEPQVPQFSEEEIEREEMKALVDMLKTQNEDLQDELTVAQATSTDDIQKEKAESVIKDLRAQIRILEIELKAVTISRDQFQSENAQLMKQVAMLQKKLKKLEAN